MLHTSGLTRRFSTRHGEVHAVRGLDLDIAEGELVGLLGPNGAGKSTAMRMLTTLLRPTAGTATVSGHDLTSAPAKVRRRIGYVAQGGSAGQDRTPREELRMQARFHGFSRAAARERAEGLIDQLDLRGPAGRTVATLSGGQQRRLDLALGLAHSPRLLFLDEPSTGLDPQSRTNLWNHIRSVRDEQQMTVLLSTHYLEEADAVCDRLIIMDHGRVIVTGTPSQLKRRTSGDLVLFTSPDPREAARVTARLPEATRVEVDGDTVRYRAVDGDPALHQLLRALDANDLTLTSLEVRRPSLDDVFLDLTGHSLREETDTATVPEVDHAA